MALVRVARTGRPLFSLLATGIFPIALLVALAVRPAAAAELAPAPIGDQCLVGQWIQRNDSAPGNWTWAGEVIAVSGQAGLIVTFTSDGLEELDLAQAQPLIGDYHGHQVKIVIRGSVTYPVHANGQQLIEGTATGAPTVQYFYDGVYVPGGTVSFPPMTITYRCTTGTLRLESPAFHAGYGPEVDDFTRTGSAVPGGSLVSTVSSTLATPAQVLRAPVALLINMALTIALVLLVTFPSHLFNRTYEENHDAIRAWWEKRLPWLKRWRVRATAVREQLRAEISYAAVVLVGGVLAALLDPGFGLNLRTLALFLGAALALTTGSAIGGAAAGFYRLARHKTGLWKLHALPSGLVVAAVCVLISRVTDFHPGYLYGLIGGVAFTRALTPREDGHVVAVTSVATLAVSLAAWLAWVPVSAASAAAPAAFGWALLSDFLAAIFVSGMVGLLISLVPLKFLPGEKLAGWHRGVWGAVFGLAGLAVIEIMLRPQSAGARVASVPFWTTAGLFVAFGTASVLFWSYFRIRERRSKVVALERVDPADPRHAESRPRP